MISKILRPRQEVDKRANSCFQEGDLYTVGLLLQDGLLDKAGRLLDADHVLPDQLHDHRVAGTVHLGQEG